MNKRIGFVLKTILVLYSCCAVQAQDSLALIRNNLPGQSARLYDKNLVEALVLQIRADSLSRIARDFRIQVRETQNDSARKQITSNMILAEKEAKSAQLLADRQFAIANSLKPAAVKQEPEGNSSIQLAGEINGIRVYQYTGNFYGNEEVNDSPAEPATGEIDTEKPTPSLQVAAPPLPAADNKETGKPLKTDDFSILDKSPYNAANPIPQGYGTIGGLTYRIQLGVFSKIRPNDAFGGITPVDYEPVAGGSMFKYFAGIFYKMNSVTAALEKVRAAGFPDAFMVAFFDGKQITTEKAREIEFSEFRMKRP